VPPVYRELQTGFCNLCNQALEPCPTGALPNENPVATPNYPETEHAPPAKHDALTDMPGLKLVASISVGVVLLLLLYATGLPYWLGISEEALPAGKAIQAMFEGPGLPLLLWWLILFGTAGMVLGGLYGLGYFICTLRRK
jgi:hypothetical protein